MSNNTNGDKNNTKQLAAEKLLLETHKLREDLSVWSRIAAIVIPIAVFFIGAAQTYIAWSDWKSKGMREQLDLDLKKIDNGVKLVEFATAEAAHLRSPDPDEARQTITYVGALLPPDMACQILSALVLHARVADELSEFAASTKEQIAQATQPPPEPCTVKSRDKQDDALIAIAKSQREASNVPSTQPPARTNAPTCTAPASQDDVSLVVFYQIMRKEDRTLASTIGFQMPSEFPSAGIEYVAQPNPSKQRPEVRYYYTNQKANADYLACLLTAAYADVTHAVNVKFEARSLEGQYKNLPTKRVEVWFPVIQPG
jgi:hypothetical protein